MRAAILAVLLCCGMAGCGSGGAGVTPLPNAHAHNDYAHPRPLLDALDQGFCSVEADVFLVEGRLLVGHEPRELKPGRTLEALYLDPLKARVAEHGGRVFRGRDARLTLMIDVKTEARATYAALREVLQRYRGMLTTWHGGRVEARAVTIVLSGNRARATIAKEAERLVAIDGRLEDLQGDASATLVPWISAPWERTFKWRGEGPMPAAERQQLREIVGRAHAQGRLVRFWATPENVEVWRGLRDAGVDLINTDDLAGLAQFFKGG